MASTKGKIWQLCLAATYNDSGRGMPSMRAMHMFGWDCEKVAFLLEDDHGMAGKVPRHLPAPRELAEAFFTRCLDAQFRNEFLADFYPREDAEEVIEAAGTSLKIRRNKAEYLSSGRQILPSLTLSIEREGKEESLCLFHELRTRLGASIAGLSESSVRAQLQG
jgi:hypothetical protein